MAARGRLQRGCFACRAPTSARREGDGPGGPICNDARRYMAGALRTGGVAACGPARGPTTVEGDGTCR